MMKLFLTLTVTFAAVCGAFARPNILFITVDDMSCDSVGAFGCALPDTTPNIDALAAEGLRFEYAHVQVGNCMPSRNVMFSGRYPHNSRMEGFYQIKDPDYPVAADLMQAAGYFAAIRGKVSHSTPYTPYGWDLILDEVEGEKMHPKNVLSFYRSTKLGIEASKKVGKPFFINVNVSDPHKPFYGMSGKGQVVDDPNKPSRIFTPDEVPIPGFLPDHPDVRIELAHYYSSVRRADDCVGEILRALEESGQAEETLVMFLSDHGMPLPFAKTTLYHHGTNTPWIVRWPGVTKTNSVDRHHLISAVDLLPTFLEIVGQKEPEGLDGHSFLPLIKGKRQSGRDWVFKEYNENSGAGRHPMRSAQSKRFGYLYNPWADGKRVFKTATTGTMAYRAMKGIAETDKEMAARVDLFEHRVQEEFYDYENDPDGLNNLINNPEWKQEIERHRRALDDWMVRTGDHALEAFRHRDDPAVASAYVNRKQEEANARRASRNKIPAVKVEKRSDLIKFALPKQARKGRELVVSVVHSLPQSLGKQKVHVTLKGGNGGRLHREVLEVSGEGVLKVRFSLSPTYSGESVGLAAFIGEDYSLSMQHITRKLPVR